MKKTNEINLDWTDNNSFTMLDYAKEVTELSKPATERYNKEMFGEDIWLPIDQIKVDILVQRDLQEYQVQKIVRKFDPTAFGRLTVTQREDGQYYCTNGQHRLRALEQLGFSQAPCILVKLYSKKDEGLNFININEASAKVSNIDKYRIGVSSEIEPWLNVKECVDYIGAKVGTGEYGISCVSVIYKLVNNSKIDSSKVRDMEAMKKTLYILNRVYGLKGITNINVQGMFTFVRYHVQSGDTSTAEVIERLEGTHPKDFSTKANALKDSNGGKGKLVSYVAYLIFVEYNKGLKKNKLPLRISL